MRAEEDLDELEGDVAEVEGHEDENGDAPAPVTVGEEGDEEAGDADAADADDDETEGGEAEGEEGAADSKDDRGDRRGRGPGRNGRKGRGRGRRTDDGDGESRMALRRTYQLQDAIRRRQAVLVPGL